MVLTVFKLDFIAGLEGEKNAFIVFEAILLYSANQVQIARKISHKNRLEKLEINRVVIPSRLAVFFIFFNRPPLKHDRPNWHKKYLYNYLLSV